MREERRVVTVLFADLVGFTARAETLDPEDVGAFLTPFYAHLTAEIERHGGTVERFIGDAVMGLFGAPTAHEDDAERGVRAALAIRDRIANEDGDLEVRIAVNTGEALVMVDAGVEGRYLVTVGDVVNTASRMQEAAPVNAVLVGETTYLTTRHAVEFREREPIPAKGKARPVPVWQAVSVRSRPGLRAPAADGLSFVGRERELDVVRSGLARARAERSTQLVTLVGPAGIGKSRLVAELRAAAAREPDPVSWLEGRCLPYGEGVSFWALGEMVKAEAGVLESDAAEAAYEKLRYAVERLVPDAGEAAWIADRLGTLVGVTETEAGSDDRSEETFTAWRHFLGALAARQPLVLAFEDLHWADAGLLDFIDGLVDSPTGLPLLVLCTARPDLLEARREWGHGHRNALILTIDPLDDDSTDRLIRSLLGERAVPDEMRTTLLARAAGNPLYAEQFVRMLFEGGKDGETAVPATVQGIIAARLDALPLEEKQLLQDAAVVGGVFWLGALEAIGSRERERAGSLLDSLDRKEFVERAESSSVEGEAEYAFRHVLLGEVAYAQIPRAARAEKHLVAAEWIESLGRPEDRAEVLAHHYLRALEYGRAGRTAPGVPADRARQALRRAGERATSLAAYARAARFYEAALECCPTGGPERADLLLRRGGTLFLAEGAGLEPLVEALDASRAAGDVERAAEAATAVSRFHWYRGDRDDAYAYIDEAVGFVAGRPPSAARARALLTRAALHMVTGEFEDALSLARDALTITEELELDALRSRALNIIGLSRVDLGEPSGVGDLEDSVAIASAANAVGQLHAAYENLRCAEIILGRLGDASRTLATQAETVERRGKAHDRAWLRFNQAEEAYMYGRWDEALRGADAFIAQVEAGLPHYLEGSCRALRGAIRLGRGELAGAEHDTGLAVGIARRAKDSQLVGPAFCARAMVLVAGGRRDEAGSLVSEVAALGPALLHALLDWFADFAWVMRDLARSAEMLELLELSPVRTRWIEIARAVATEDPIRAADLLGEIGHTTGEAYARLRAGELLHEAGNVAEADGQLARAAAFYRAVGAADYAARSRRALTA